MPSAFVDTNFLLYAVSHHPVERAKSLRAQELILAEDIQLSVQGGRLQGVNGRASERSNGVME